MFLFMAGNRGKWCTQLVYSIARSASIFIASFAAAAPFLHAPKRTTGAFYSFTST